MTAALYRLFFLLALLPVWKLNALDENVVYYRRGYVYSSGFKIVLIFVVGLLGFLACGVNYYRRSLYAKITSLKNSEPKKKKRPNVDGQQKSTSQPTIKDGQLIADKKQINSNETASSRKSEGKKNLSSDQVCAKVESDKKKVDSKKTAPSGKSKYKKKLPLDEAEMRRRGYVNRKCERLQPEKPNPTPKDVSIYEDCGLRSSIYCASPFNSSVASTADTLGSGKMPTAMKKPPDTVTTIEISHKAAPPSSKASGSEEKLTIKKKSSNTAVDVSPGDGPSGSKSFGEKPTINKNSLATAVELSEAERSVKK